MCRRKKKIQRKFLNSIGKESYSFDIDKEKAIYGYLAYYKLSRREIKLLGEDLKFNSYKQWKAYIINKYDYCDIDGLKEFYRYLKLRQRTVKFSISYWAIFIPALVTLCFNFILDKSIIDKILELDFSVLIEIVGQLNAYLIEAFIKGGFILFLVFMCLWFIKTIIEPMPQNDLEKYLYKDYIEIIQELISEKENTQNSSKCD